VIQVRKAAERGHFKQDWLDTYHTFSFDRYYDPKYMGFRDLRVINEDRVAAGGGFPTHPHRDMEIITYILDGALQHRDSMGTGSIIRPGDVQRMSAGTGVTHSEFNASQSEPVHLLQIWIIPERKGLEPSYEQKAFDREQVKGRLRLVASNHPRDGAIRIHQSAELYAGILEPGDVAHYEMQPKRYAWLQVARGSINLNGKDLHAGDGAAIWEESSLEILGKSDSEILLFDLA
jgi:quercetin 2,3-dioxygenase